MANELSIEESLFASIANSDLKSLAIELSEVGLDQILKDGLAKDIPVLGSIVGFAGAAITIRDCLFAKKLAIFLANFEATSKEQRKEQLDKLALDASERKRVGEHLLLLLDKMNDMTKPAMIARAFQAYLSEGIDRDQFQALSHVIDVINVASIPDLRRFYLEHKYHQILEPNHHIQHLTMCGLFSINLKKIDTTARYGNGGSRNEKPAGEFVGNDLGRLFCDVVLSDDGSSTQD